MEVKQTLFIYRRVLSEYVSGSQTVLQLALLKKGFLKNPMDRGSWQATVHGVARVRHDLVTKQELFAIKSNNIFVMIFVKHHETCYTEGQYVSDSHICLLQGLKNNLSITLTHVELRGEYLQ